MYIIGSEHVYDLERWRGCRTKGIEEKRSPLLYTHTSIKKVLHIYTYTYIYTHTKIHKRTQKYTKECKLPRENVKFTHVGIKGESVICSRAGYFFCECKVPPIKRGFIGSVLMI